VLVIDTPGVGPWFILTDLAEWFYKPGAAVLAQTSNTLEEARSSPSEPCYF
jgi:hypothetical protein